MDSRSLEENSYEAFAAKNTQMPPDTRNTTEFLEENGHRQSTDKNWFWFFLVIFVCWIASWQYAIIHHLTDHDVLPATVMGANNISHEIDHKIFLEVAKNIFKFVHDKKGNGTNPVNDTDPKTIESKLTILFDFLFDLFTCKPAHLADPATIWGYTLVIGAHMYIGLMYFVVSLMSITHDKIFCKQPSIFVATFLFMSLFGHLPALSSSVAFSLQPVHERLAYWVLPEALFLIFCLSKILSRGQSKERNPLLPLPFYVYTIAVGIPVFLILEHLIAFTINISHNLGWKSALFYMITGGSCYVGLTIYYFGLMIISCAMRVSSDGPQSLWKDPFRAFFIVARYHFGTACYQATLIFPISHALDIIKEVSKFSETKERRIRRPKRRISENPRKNKEKESCLTYRKIYSNPITLTAVYGTDFSRSLRKLLRFWSNDVFSKEYIYNYRPFIWYLFLLIMSTNSLMIILLWSLGLDDSTFTLATWVLYIKIMVMYYLAMQYFKATSDAIVFCVYRKLEGPSGNIPDEKLRINYARVPNTKSYEVRIKLT